MQQERRKFLKAGSTAVIGLVAGCTSDEEEVQGGDHTDGGGTTAEPTNTPTMTPTTAATATDSPTPTATPTPKADPAIEITSSKLEKTETSYSTDAYIIGRVENNGNGVSGQVSLKGRFYDDGDNLLDSTSGSLHYLKPGEVWEFYIPFLDDGEKASSHKIDGEYETEPPRMQFADISVADTQLNKGDYDASVTGTMQNDLDESIDYLAAKARFWRDDVILAGGLDNISDVPAGENWSFEATYLGYGDRWGDANGFDVVPQVTIY